MTSAQPGSRQALLRRGWYVATEIEVAFMGLSGRAHDLLIILKHLQGEHADAHPSRERLAELMGVSVRTLAGLLTELRRKGAVVTSRTGRASRYSATYGRATPAEIRVLLGGDLAIPADLQVDADVQDSCLSDVQESCLSSSYKEPPNKNYNYLPTGGRRRPAPQPDQPQEDEMKRNGARPHGVIVDELDPAAAVGLWGSQELPDAPETGADDPDGLFPLPAAPSRSEGRSRTGRTQAQLDAPMALATELDHAIRAADWNAGPAPVNRSALARNLSAWKRDGLTADQIRAMIQRYVSDPSLRAPGKTPWIDFVGKRHRLLAAEARAAVTTEVESHRDADEAYWLGSAA